MMGLKYRDVSSCVIPACTPCMRRKIPRLSMHRFPKFSGRKRQEWIDIVRTLKNKESWEPSKCSVICSRHFEEKYFSKQNTCRQRLDIRAIPTLFLVEEQSMSTHGDNEQNDTSPIPTPPLSLPCLICGEVNTISEPSPNYQEQVELYKMLILRPEFCSKLHPDLIQEMEERNFSCANCLPFIQQVWDLQLQINSVIDKARIKVLLRNPVKVEGEASESPTSSPQVNQREEMQYEEEQEFYVKDLIHPSSSWEDSSETMSSHEMLDDEIEEQRLGTQDLHNESTESFQRRPERRFVYGKSFSSQKSLRAENVPLPQDLIQNVDIVVKYEDIETLHNIRENENVQNCPLN